MIATVAQLSQEYFAYHRVAPIAFETELTTAEELNEAKARIDVRLGNRSTDQDWQQMGYILGLTLYDASMERFVILLVADRLKQPNQFIKTALHEIAHVHTLPRVDYDRLRAQNAMVNHGLASWAEFVAEVYMLPVVEHKGIMLNLPGINHMIRRPNSQHPQIACAQIGYYLAHLYHMGLSPADMLNLQSQGLNEALESLMEISEFLLRRGIESVRYSDLHRYGARSLAVLDALKDIK